MKGFIPKAFPTVALLSAIGTTIWSPSSFACSSDPYIGSICAMALSRNYGFGGGTYIPAAGQQLNVSQNPALFALIGKSYGGDGATNFKLPDLRGKVIVGYDDRVPSQSVGTTGGSYTQTLTIAQLPQHNFTITNMPVNFNALTATTTLAGLSGTADLSRIVLTGPVSGLVINASSQNGLSSPSGNFIGKSNGTAGNIYTTSAPDVTLNSGTIGGNLSLTVNNGVTAPVSISGTASTTVTGVGTASGTTNIIGGAQPFSTMPPYLVMNYYIAVKGLYPSQDD